MNLKRFEVHESYDARDLNRPVWIDENGRLTRSPISPDPIGEVHGFHLSGSEASTGTIDVNVRLYCRFCRRWAVSDELCEKHGGRSYVFARQPTPRPIVLSDQVEPSVTRIAAPWKCAYCGTANRGDQLECGAGEWGGCGASRFDADPDFARPIGAINLWRPAIEPTDQIMR